MSRARFWGSLGEPPEEGPDETVRGGLECGACGGRLGLALGATWRSERGGGVGRCAGVLSRCRSAGRWERGREGSPGVRCAPHP